MNTNKNPMHRQEDSAQPSTQPDWGQVLEHARMSPPTVVPAEIQPLLAPFYRPARDGDWQITAAPAQSRPVLGYFNKEAVLSTATWVR